LEKIELIWALDKIKILYPQKHSILAICVIFSTYSTFMYFSKFWAYFASKNPLKTLQNLAFLTIAERIINKWTKFSHNLHGLDNFSKKNIYTLLVFEFE